MCLRSTGVRIRFGGCAVGSSTSPSHRLTLSAALLSLDALALRVIQLLDNGDIPTILLKGPVTASWLYDDPLDHPYTDVDLLIAPEDDGRASRLLKEAGFRDFHASTFPIYRPPRERAWVNPEGIVDLHTSIQGIPFHRAHTAWDILDGAAVPFLLHGRSVRMLSERGRALHLALHAAQKYSGRKAVQDLEQGLMRLSEDIWPDAARLAFELDATAAYVAGMSRTAEGRRHIAKLPIPVSPTVSSVLQSRGAIPEAHAIAHLSSLPPGQRWKHARNWLSLDDKAGMTRPQVLLRRLKVVARLPLGAAQWWRARHRS